METVRVQMPRSEYARMYGRCGAAFAAFLAFCIFSVVSVPSEAQAFAHGQGARHAAAPLLWDPRLMTHVACVTVAAVVCWLPILPYLYWAGKRQAYMLTERGIRVERVPFVKGEVAWADVSKVCVSKLGPVYLMEADRSIALEIRPWARGEVWPELERRLRLRLERTTWFSTLYVCETAA